VNDELMPVLLEGNKIMHIFSAVPEKIHYLVRDNERVWRAFGKVLRGDKDYCDVRSGFGKWKSLWNLACFIAGLIEKSKEFRFRRNGFPEKQHNE
jgi:hypothetical protein